MYLDGNIASSGHINLTFRMPISKGRIKGLEAKKDIQKVI